ncbi:uncharacterized protein [Asterias amurensis]|uniref:uncharacterized protein n=1 Tax=Asterias amurensis TaxID=7602 RepID=UPI003AB4B3FE
MLEQAKAQNIDVVGKIFHIANFAAAILDCHGGCLSIDDLDVHLYVPPGAIPEEQTQQVYIYVTGTSSVESHYFSTPFIHCGPPDTVFNKDVVLTMPHCVKDTSSCKFSLSKLSSGGSSELREGSDVITVVDNDSITFSINRFCRIRATASPVHGTILEKTMIACLFIREDSHSEDEITLRLRLVDDVQANVQEVKTEERRHRFYLADMVSPLIVRKNDQDVVAKISTCSESWEISEPESCQLKFNSEFIWPETAAVGAQGFPSGLIFAKRHRSPQKVPFKARMTVYQEDGSGSCNGVDFLVDATQRPTRGDHSFASSLRYTAAETSIVSRLTAKLGEQVLESNEEQTQTAKRSVEQRKTSLDVNSEVSQSVEESTTYSQPPTLTDSTLIEKKDFLKSFESMLEQAKAQSIDVVGKVFQIANFAAAILDCQGGCLSIDNLDVHLYVPPGAIPEEQTQQVYIYVTGTSSVESHYYSTPFVHCGPPDTVFDKDVVLTMPHCVKDTSSCKFSLSKLSSGGSSELREGSDVITVVDNDSITFSINRFCRNRATASPVDGTILKKTMIACLFIREDGHSEDEITLRLRLVDDVKVNVQEVKTEERNYGFHLADMKSSLTVLKNDLDVVAKISNCSESWEISEPESCQLKFNSEFIWPETAAVGAQGFPSGLIFAKRHRSPQKVPFKARMTVYQEDGSGSCNGVDFLVDATQRPTKGDHSFASSLRYTAAETSIVSRLTAKLGEQVLECNEEQTQTAKSVEQHKTSLDVNLEEIKSVEESTTYSKLPTLTDFTLIEKKDFLKSFESMLEQAKAQSIDVVGKVFQIANFAAAVLDCQGGCLSIDNLDVHLYVPPGAIPEEQTQQVYIYVTGTSSVESHYLSTPFVHCGPPDTVFNKDVVLTIPHCVKDTSTCKFSLAKLSLGGSSELSEGSDVITVVDNDSITFSVNHFCGFGATASPVDGTILKKTMIACLFIHEDSHSEDVVTLRLRLVDDVKVNVLEVKTEEGKHGFYSADVDSPLIVQKNNQDVVAKISNCNSSWELSEPESCQQKIHRDLLWRETEASRARAFPSAMFVAERRSGSRKVCFTARMTVLQEGSEVYGANFFVDANKERIQQPALDRETQIDRIKQMFLEQMANLQCTSVKPRLLEESIFNKLCDLFDDPNPLGNDWRNLATLLLNRSVSIGSINGKAGRERRSPTEVVFELFVGRQSGRTEEETRATLTGALIDMNRPDAEFAIVAIREH